MTNPTSCKDPREDPRYLADDSEPGAVFAAYLDCMSLGAWADDDMDAFRAAVLAELREIGPHSICERDWDSGEDVEREVSPEESFEEVSFERIPMSRRLHAIWFAYRPELRAKALEEAMNEVNEVVGFSFGELEASLVVILESVEAGEPLARAIEREGDTYQRELRDTLKVALLVLAYVAAGLVGVEIAPEVSSKDAARGMSSEIPSVRQLAFRELVAAVGGRR